jgi:hypothetical protein
MRGTTRPAAVLTLGSSRCASPVQAWRPPEASTEGALDRERGVAASLRNEPESILLLQCEPWRKCAEPRASLFERAAPGILLRVNHDPIQQLGRSPGDPALPVFEDRRPCLDTSFAQEVVRVSGRRKVIGINDLDGAADASAG